MGFGKIILSTVLTFMPLFVSAQTRLKSGVLAKIHHVNCKYPMNYGIYVAPGYGVVIAAVKHEGFRVYSAKLETLAWAQLCKLKDNSFPLVRTVNIDNFNEESGGEIISITEPGQINNDQMAGQFNADQT